MDQTGSLADMNQRTREIFRRVVESYIESGEPIGSRTITRVMSEQLSAATVRNVMQDLEFSGLLNSPHTSAGRIPTEAGLRLFVDGLLEISEIDQNDRTVIDAAATESDRDISTILADIGSAMSGITGRASVVLAPKQDDQIKHIEFVSLSQDRALVVLVFSSGTVENRIFLPPVGTTPSSMREAANFLNSLATGRTIADLQRAVHFQIQIKRNEIDSLARGLVEKGLAVWLNKGSSSERLIVRGSANLIESQIDSQHEIERVRVLFEDLEQKKDIAEFLELTESGEGVRIFIGSENKLFSLSGSSLIVSPYLNEDRKIIGAVGVIGPTRLNYGRIVPIVDYTSQLVSRLLSGHRTG